MLDLLDAYFAAATMAHEYADDLHYKLATLQADDLHTRKLLADSADVVLREMPRLVRELRGLTRQWEEQALLDPAQAERTASRSKLVGCIWRLSSRRFASSKTRSWPSWRSSLAEQVGVDDLQATKRSAAACS